MRLLIDREPVRPHAAFSRRRFSAWLAGFCLLPALVAGVARPSSGQTLVPNWVQQSPAASPTTRVGAAMAYYPPTGQVVLFGGVDLADGTYLSDTWTWNGTTWTQQSPASSPSARKFAGMVYDAAMGELLLFGGTEGSSDVFNDTWAWNGTTWTQLNPASSPSGRVGFSMAYDSLHSQAVLFGGSTEDPTQFLNDTWLWNGSTWTQASPATSPSPRYFAQMDFDSNLGQTVLFGGDWSGDILSDTWIWNGSTWTKQSPANSPPALWNGAMAYDVSQGASVLFGGGNASQAFNETWLWNGSNWIDATPSSNPSARDVKMMAYDAADGQILLFGGASFSGTVYNDTWAYGQSSFNSQAVGSSATQTFNFSIPANTTVGSFAVLTTGLPNLDFTDAGGDTCTATTYASATICAVNVQFSPKAPGLRQGAVVFYDGSGNVLTTTYLSGTGTGPQVGYLGAAPAVLFSAPVGTYGLAVDAGGNFYRVEDSEPTGSITVLNPSGAVTRTISTNGYPSNVAVDGAGNVYYSAQGPPSSGAFQVTPNGTQTEIGSFEFAGDLAVDGAGDLYVANNGVLYEVTPSGTQTTINGPWYAPAGIALDAAGNLYVADYGDTSDDSHLPAVYKLAPNGSTTTIGSFSYENLEGVAVDAAGNVFVLEEHGSVYEVTPAGVQSEVGTGSFGDGAALAVDSAGNLYVSSYQGKGIYKIDRADAPSESFATSTPTGLTDTTDGTETVQVVNLGNAPLNFSAVTYPADFSANSSDTNPCTATTALSPAATCDLPIEFTPVNVGAPLTESVTLTDNALNATNAKQSVSVTGTSTPGQIAVPDVVGDTQAAATAAITGAGLVVGTVTSASSSTVASGEVISQSPSAATTVNTGSSVNLVISSGPVQYTLTIAPNNAAYGAVTPASGSSYPVATVVSITATPSSGYYFVNWSSSPDAVAGATSASTTIPMNAAENVTANFGVNLVVTTATDDSVGTASNCTAQATPGSNTTDTSCSLRDALAAASVAGSGNITFASAPGQLFSSAQTITLLVGGAGTLTIPSNTTITGPTTGSGYGLTNLVTVNGGGAAVGAPVFTGAATGGGSSINNLIITNGIYYGYGAGGIFNSATSTLTVTNSTIAGNQAPSGSGGIYNDSATMTILNSTVSGNSGIAGGLTSGPGGSLTVIGATISGNSGNSESGGVHVYNATATITNSTISGNTSNVAGGGIDNVGGTLALANSIVSGNTSPASADITGGYTDNGGNQVGTGFTATALGSYGGPTQTMVPQVGDAAICGATLANATAAGIAADQRGFAFDPNCPSGKVDSGAVQSYYNLQFSNVPRVAIAGQAVAPAISTALFESGVAQSGSANSVTLSDSGSTLSGTLTQPMVGGVASFPGVGFSTIGFNTQLVATMALNSSASLVHSAGVLTIVAPVPAVVSSPAAGATLNGPGVAFSWSPASGAAAYSLWIGTTGVGSSNLYDSGARTATSVTVPGLPTNGATLYVRLNTIYNGVATTSDSTYTASTRAAITAPASPGTLTGPGISFAWSPATGAVGYSLWLGTAGVGSSNLYDSGAKTATSVTVPNLPTNGQTVYARINTIYAGGLSVSNDYVYTASTRAAITSPTAPGPLAGSTVTFAWSPATGAVSYSLWIGSTGVGSSDLYNSHSVTATSATAKGLPTNGETVYVRINTIYAGGVSVSTDSTYTAQ